MYMLFTLIYEINITTPSSTNSDPQKAAQKISAKVPATQIQNLSALILPFVINVHRVRAN
jgi:hypothetical protein